MIQGRRKAPLGSQLSISFGPDEGGVRRVVMMGTLPTVRRKCQAATSPIANTGRDVVFRRSHSRAATRPGAESIRRQDMLSGRNILGSPTSPARIRGPKTAPSARHDSAANPRATRNAPATGRAGPPWPPSHRADTWPRNADRRRPGLWRRAPVQDLPR